LSDTRDPNRLCVGCRQAIQAGSTMAGQRQLQPPGADSDARSAPTCPVCSKPVRSGSLVLFQYGALIHVRCRRHAFGLTIAQTSDQSWEAKAVEVSERAAWLIDELKRHRGQHELN
jgi:hypothetical protein